MKKRIIILSVITILILLGLSLIFNLIPKIFDIGGRSAIEGKVVSVPASLSIKIIPKESVEVPEAGNVTFSGHNINKTIKLIENLEAGWILNISMHENSFPHDWAEPEPLENEVKTEFRYFELNNNNNNSVGSYKIYFTLNLDDLGTANANDVRLFVYESGWVELPTAVIHASDPIEFYAVTTHFSKFLIGEKPSSEESATTQTTSGGGCSHRWKCMEWGGCTKEGIQKRICEYTGSCRTPNINPYPVEQECKYIPKEEILEEEKPEEDVPKDEELLKKPELEKPSPIVALLPQILILKGVIIIILIVLSIILIKEKILKNKKRGIRKSRSRK